LPESSFIRAAIDFVIESGKKGEKELEYNASEICCGFKI